MGQLPVTCGLFFSLGHSTIVIVVVRHCISPPKCIHTECFAYFRMLPLLYLLTYITESTVLALSEGSLVGGAIIPCLDTNFNGNRICRERILSFHRRSGQLHYFVENNQATSSRKLTLFSN